MSVYRFHIDGRLQGMNEYTKACRTKPILGALMKKEAQERVCYAILAQLRGVKITKPVLIEYWFYEPNRKRDFDNISGFAHKVIQDALVECGVIKNDGWKQIVGYNDRFLLNRNTPTIDIALVEMEV